jgi:hypothetical protein
VNRYLATLSALFSWAVQQLRWIKDSPCANLMKLKKNPGRDRVLSIDLIFSAIPSSCFFVRYLTTDRHAPKSLLARLSLIL